VGTRRAIRVVPLVSSECRASRIRNPRSRHDDRDAWLARAKTSGVLSSTDAGAPRTIKVDIGGLDTPPCPLIRSYRILSTEKIRSGTPTCRRTRQVPSEGFVSAGFYTSAPELESLGTGSSRASRQARRGMRCRPGEARSPANVGTTVAKKPPLPVEFDVSHGGDDRRAFVEPRGFEVARFICTNGLKLLYLGLRVVRDATSFGMVVRAGRQGCRPFSRSGQTAVSFQVKLGSSGLNDGESPGNVNVPVDHTVFSPLSGVSREPGPEAKNRRCERLRFFDLSSRKFQLVPCQIHPRQLRLGPVAGPVEFDVLHDRNDRPGFAEAR